MSHGAPQTLELEIEGLRAQFPNTQDLYHGVK